MTDENKFGSANIDQILKALPHRYPFLMIDRIEQIDGDKSAVGIKNVTINEPFFQGHFPGSPVMPGVLLIEAMAQTAGAICIFADDSKAVQTVYFMSIDKARFRRPVVPGDVVHFHVNQLKHRRKVWKFRGEAKVEGKLVAEAEITAMIANSDGAS